MLVVAALGWPGLGAEARAQFGGFGFGWGIPLNNVPSPVNQVNEMSRIAGQAAFAAREQTHSPYAGNPNAYMNIGRQLRFSQPELLEPRYNARTRRELPDQLASQTRRTNTFAGPTRTGNTATTTRPEAQPVAVATAGATIDRFFNQYQELTWPSDSPREGELGPLRDQSDTASHVVLKQVKENGRAGVDEAAVARTKLLNYGRPALQYIRTNASPAVADSFHTFLLSLYDALGRAATDPVPAKKP